VVDGTGVYLFGGWLNLWGGCKADTDPRKGGQNEAVFGTVSVIVGTLKPLDSIGCEHGMGGTMGFWSRRMGFRWSLYIVQNDRELCYVMHDNSVMNMIGYVMSSFEGGGPVEPWSLVLNFNHNNKTIKLEPAHFSSNGESCSKLLISQITSIDPGWMVRGTGEPVFEEASTKRRLKISKYKIGETDYSKMLEITDDPPETTFFSVLDLVFGRSE